MTGMITEMRWVGMLFSVKTTVASSAAPPSVFSFAGFVIGRLLQELHRVTGRPELGEQVDDLAGPLR